MFQLIRLKKLMLTLGDASTLEDAYKLVEGFMGTTTMIDGSITHKNMQVYYSFGVNREFHTLRVFLRINDLTQTVSPTQQVGAQQQQPFDILHLSLIVNEQQLPLLQGAVSSFLHLLG